LFFFAGLGALVGPPLMGFTADATGGITTSILLVGAIATAGVLVLLPMSRQPLALPTYVGPGTPMAPPPAAAPTAPRPLVPRPAVAPSLIRQRLAWERAIPTIRPLADRTAEALEQTRPAALLDAPPEVFWPVPAEGAVDRNGAAAPAADIDAARRT